jgi:cytochrome c6
MGRELCVVLALLAMGTVQLGGCKKEAPPKAEAPQAAPAPPPAANQAAAKSGEELFKQHCAVCHPDGGNIVKPEDTLHGKALAKHHITTSADIVKTMRNPGQGMTKFDEATISDKDATAIAEYVLKIFK